MDISLIAALDAERGIGKDGGIPWHIPGEQVRFKQITTGHPIIMGRKTFESIGRALPERTNIVITRQVDYQAPGCTVVSSLAEALATAESATGGDIAYVTGGSGIFAEALPLATRLDLTLIEGTFGADTFFPAYPDFVETNREEHEAAGTKFAYVTYVPA